MNAFAAAIVGDLRAFCSELLEAGIAPGGAGGPRERGGSATFSGLLRNIDALTSIVPQLLDNLDSDESPTHVECVRAATPQRSTLPRRPQDWQLATAINGAATPTPQLMPRHWDRLLPRLTFDTRPLGFVLHVVEHLAEDFETVRMRLSRHIEEARIARNGVSDFARQDAEALDVLSRRLDGGTARLERCRQLLQRNAGARVSADSRLPRPFPRHPCWTAFRRLADAILRPEQFLASTLGELLRDDTPLADLPFLYQRWVGVRLLLELCDTFGFQVLGDATGALFLGGVIELRRETTALHLWCEPRLAHGAHPSGLIATSREHAEADVTPDYVLVTPGSGGPDAFVLDATMSHDPTLLDRKTRYRERIAFREFRPAAGVPGRRLPLRAWAAVPIAGIAHNQLSRPDGSGGTVPMQPDAFAPGPLQAWLGDLIDHADAWQLLADARQARG
ncbi:MAG: hypothetical protein R3F29_03480 [Planctomycetota bacterium]